MRGRVRGDIALLELKGLIFLKYLNDNLLPES